MGVFFWNKQKINFFSCAFVVGWHLFYFPGSISHNVMCTSIIRKASLLLSSLHETLISLSGKGSGNAIVKQLSEDLGIGSPRTTSWINTLLRDDRSISHFGDINSGQVS